MSTTLKAVRLFAVLIGAVGTLAAQQPYLAGSNVNGHFTPWTSSLTSGQIPTPPSILMKCKNGGLTVDCPLPGAAAGTVTASSTLTNLNVIMGTGPASIANTPVGVGSLDELANFGITNPTANPIQSGMNIGGLAYGSGFAMGGAVFLDSGTYKVAYYSSTAMNGQYYGCYYPSGTPPTSFTGLTCPIFAPSNGGAVQLPKGIAIGTPAGSAASIFVLKDPTKYGMNVYDASGSTTSLTPNYDSEIYGITGALTATRANYRSHLDNTNTTASLHQLGGFISGCHGNNTDCYQFLADGLHATGLYGYGDGDYGIFLQNGQAAYTITNVVTSAGSCQFTLSSSHNLVPGSTVNVASVGGATGCNANGQTVTAVNNALNQFTTGQAFSGSYTSGGTAFQVVSTIGVAMSHYSNGGAINIQQTVGTVTNLITLNTAVGGLGSCTNALEVEINSSPVFDLGCNGTVNAVGVHSFSNTQTDTTWMGPNNAVVATATTIAPTTAMFALTGTTSVATITPPSGFSATVGGCLDFYTVGTAATTTAGNILNVVVLTANTMHRACYFANGGTPKWAVQ